MKINLNYGRKISAENKEGAPSDSELTLNYLEHAVNTKYEKGLDGSLRRIWGRVQKKIGDAIDNKADDVVLDKSEFDFVAKAFSEAKFPSVYSQFVLILEDEIDRVKDEMKKE